MSGLRAQYKWRWFRSPKTGEPVASRELESLNPNGQGALKAAIRRYCRDESPHGEVKRLTNTGGLIELRVRIGNDPYRAVFFKESDAPVVVGVLAVYKNQQKLPRSEVNKAMRRRDEWIAAGKARRR